MGHALCYATLALGLVTMYWIWDYTKKFGKK